MLSDSAVGRGVLIDYWDFIKEKYDPNTTYRISLAELQACAERQGTTFEPGDILLIRSGWVETYNNMDEDQKTRLGNVAPTKYTFVGVEQSEEMIDFLHDNYFSAVGGDAPAFEAWPSNQSWYHHEYLLSLWGVPIGEMLDLEKLSSVCKQFGRYTFFFTSSPANVSGESSSHQLHCVFTNVKIHRWSREYPQCDGHLLRQQRDRRRKAEKGRISERPLPVVQEKYCGRIILIFEFGPAPTECAGLKTCCQSQLPNLILDDSMTAKNHRAANERQCSSRVGKLQLIKWLHITINSPDRMNIICES